MHAPLNSSTARKALDIGCGTGIVTHQIASQFPTAQVCGLDLSPVPIVREKLPNIEYIQGNFDDLTSTATPDARFGKGTFDYIFSRLLVLGMTNWKGYVDRCVALLKPGVCTSPRKQVHIHVLTDAYEQGWVEMHDLAISFYRAPNPLTATQRASLEPHSLTLAEFESRSHPADAWHDDCDWVKVFQELCAEKGMDATCGQQLPGMFAAAGLEDVQIKRYLYAMAPWEGLTEAETRFGEFHRVTMGRLIPPMIRKMAQGQNAVSHDRVVRASEEAEKEATEGHERRGFVFFYVVCGRKPMS